jgi:hypothetical protein
MAPAFWGPRHQPILAGWKSGLPSGMKRVEIGNAVDAKDHGLTTITNELDRFFSAASTISG